jgi:hypothetical protein
MNSVEAVSWCTIEVTKENVKMHVNNLHSKSCNVLIVSEEVE